MCVLYLCDAALSIMSFFVVFSSSSSRQRRLDLLQACLARISEFAPSQQECLLLWASGHRPNVLTLLRQPSTRTLPPPLPAIDLHAFAAAVEARSAPRAAPGAAAPSASGAPPAPAPEKVSSVKAPAPATATEPTLKDGTTAPAPKSPAIAPSNKAAPAQEGKGPVTKSQQAAAPTPTAPSAEPAAPAGAAPAASPTGNAGVPGAAGTTSTPAAPAAAAAPSAVSATPAGVNGSAPIVVEGSSALSQQVPAVSGGAGAAPTALKPELAAPPALTEPAGEQAPATRAREKMPTATGTQAVPTETEATGEGALPALAHPEQALVAGEEIPQVRTNVSTSLSLFPSGREGIIRATASVMDHLVLLPGCGLLILSFSLDPPARASCPPPSCGVPTKRPPPVVHPRVPASPTRHRMTAAVKALGKPRKKRWQRMLR